MDKYILTEEQRAKTEELSRSASLVHGKVTVKHFFDENGNLVSKMIIPEKMELP